jgi:hypothetical protein
MKHLDLELTNGLPSSFYGTTNLSEEVYGRWLGFGKDIDVICCHTFLGNEHLFGSVDDEITSRVVRALIEIVQVLVLKSTQDTKRGPQHDRNLFQR